MSEKSMKTMKRDSISILLLCLIVLAGCTAPIDIETDDSEPQITIYGVLTDEVSNQVIRITSTSSYFDSALAKAVSGATVTVTSSENRVFEFMEVERLPGYYATEEKWAVSAGERYTLTVEVDFDEDGVVDTYRASTDVPPKPLLDSVRIVPTFLVSKQVYTFDAYWQDPEPDNYYLFHFNVNDDRVTDNLSRYVISDDILFTAQYINGLALEIFRDLSNWDDDQEDLRSHSFYVEPGDRIELEMSMITKGYYDFISQCQSQMNGENPFFGGPPANITTNISNGGVGFFTAYCTDRMGATVKIK